MTEIRAAVPRDFLAVAALDRVAWGDDPVDAFIPDGEHVWRLWCEHALTFVAEREGEIVGAAVAFLCLDGRYCLHKIFVSADCRGAGVGSELMRAILARIDEDGAETFLTVNPVNEAAQTVYRRWGFEPHELVKGFYREAEDRWVYVRGAAG